MLAAGGGVAAATVMSTLPVILEDLGGPFTGAIQPGQVS